MMQKRFILLSALCLLGVAPIATASCPDLTSGEGDVPRWAWNLIYFVYDGSFSSTAVGDAASLWTSAQSIVDIEPFGEYDDIDIHDDDSIAPALGDTMTYGQNYDSGCYDTYDQCMRCMNSSFMFYSTIWLSPTENEDWAAVYGVSAELEYEMTVAHELGHVLALDDDMGDTDCSYPSIMSYTDSNECSPVFAGPQSCDANSVDTSYNGYSVLPFSMCAGCSNGSCN